MKNIEEKGYKYLGILEADGVKHEEMKVQIKKEYIRRVRNILKSIWPSIQEQFPL